MSGTHRSLATDGGQLPPILGGQRPSRDTLLEVEDVVVDKIMLEIEGSPASHILIILAL